jgi:cell fate (sporulation/competence/biofilm development) regulator YlbF (YheA/YmcA/DUF963 family)
MGVYDIAHELSRTLKVSQEYREYKEIKEEISKDPALKEKVDEFEKIRYEEQLLAMQGEKQNSDKMAKLQELYKILIQNPEVKDYFDKEVKFNVMIADINKIIGEAIKDVL